MRLKLIIVALRNLAIWFGFGATKQPSPVRSPAASSSSKPTRADADDAVAAPEQQLAHDSARGDSDHDDGTTEEHTSGEQIDDDQERDQPETGGHSEVDEPEGKIDDSSSATKPKKSERKPHRIGGKRDPQSPSPKPGQRLQSPSSCPDLTLRRVPASQNWEIILNADRACRLAVVFLDDARLDHNTQECCIPIFTGRLVVSCQDGQEHEIPLFKDAPLIFKLPKNWSGDGRKIARITNGHFIVIAPASWKRVGRVPVEPDSCVDSAFRAHYFHRSVTTASDGHDGFLGWNGSLFASGVELTGQCVLDDSDEGDLFVGEAPRLKSSQKVAWARVGEETKGGWGKNFRPDEQSLPEVLDDKEGRFFLRIYDSGMSMLDSMAFRRLRNLNRIQINGADFSQGTVILPKSTGYPSTNVRFIGADGSTLSPILPVGAPQKVASSGVIEVPQNPNADRITCNLGSNSRRVNIVLNLPRIWWRIECDHSDPSEWRDTPLVMTRDEFREHAYANDTMQVLSRGGIRTIRAGFDDQFDQPYNSAAKDDCIAIPLSDFGDHKQIDCRLYSDTYFNIEWGGKVVRLIQISAEILPEIVSFTAEPATIEAGQEVILDWATRNVSDARVEIDPGRIVVKPNGNLRVEPAASLQFTLRLKPSGMDDVTRKVAVTVQTTGQTRDLMTPIQLLEKVVEMQAGMILEYYRGHLGSDVTSEANRLRNATQYWKGENVLNLVQGKIAEGKYAYLAIRTSVPIKEDAIERAHILQVRQVS
ncbi:MAG: hypothetical protein OXF56_01355 [Rhodobacteraceae bacterium]|nr:hypothetical protein [Paracoccaceae bacterium]